MSSIDSRPVAIYCRISDDPEGRRLGVDRQEISCRRLAAQRGWHSAEVYIDNDISAFSGVLRPAYRRMLDDLQLRRLAAVVAWDADRLHRATRELEDFIDLIDALAIPVLTVTSGEADFATASGRMQARIKGTVSRYESEHKTERTRAAHASLAEAGRWKGGPRPYGYDVDRDNYGRSLNDGRLVVIPDEAAIIREAATRVLAGETVYGVCNDLNARGVPTAQGRRWRTQTLRRILTHATVMGKREYRGTIVATAMWPALLTEQQWLELRRRLGTGESPSPAAKGTGRRRTYLLTGGIAICGVCNSNLHAHTRSPGIRAYNCVSGPDKEGCGGVTISAPRLDGLVVNAVLNRYQIVADPQTLLADVSACTDQREEGVLQSGINELAELFVQGQLSAAAWRIAQAGIAAMAHAEPEREDRTIASAALLDQWTQLPLAQRRERISNVLEHVVVSPTTQRGNTFDDGRIRLLWRQDENAERVHSAD